MNSEFIETFITFVYKEKVLLFIKEETKDIDGNLQDVNNQPAYIEFCIKPDGSKGGVQVEKFFEKGILQKTILYQIDKDGNQGEQLK